MYPVVYHLAGYRRKVVRTNLAGAFPEKGLDERLSIERKYYRHLCDMVVETVKTRGISAKELSGRMVIKNPELINSCFEARKSVIIIAAHQGNWEWLVHIPLFVNHHCYMVYKPLENEFFDHYMNRVREKFGGEAIPMSLALRKLLEAEKSHVPVLTWLAADQAPPWNHPFWIDFMHQHTMFFNGPAKLARRFDQPVFFQQIRKIRRGYYETWFEPLVENPRQLAEEEIIRRYVRKSESVICNDPALYLWSHRRWKYKKQGDAPVY